MHKTTKRRADCPEKKHQLEEKRQENRLDALQDQIIKMQDRFDYFIMLELKHKKIHLVDCGSKKELDQPNFKSDRLIEQIEVFDELNEFKRFAARANMDDEREFMKENMNKDVRQKQWLTRLALDVQNQTQEDKTFGS